MGLTADQAVETVKELIPAWRDERKKLDRVDAWMRWDHDPPHKPRQSTPEYRELAARSQAPWGDLVVGSVAQTMYVQGYRRPGSGPDSTGWQVWQANGMDARQVAIHRAMLGYGVAYGVGMPGETLTGAPMPVLRGLSPREMLAVYDDPAMDEWPVYALRLAKHRGRWDVWLYDDAAEHRLQLGTDLAATPTYIAATEHPAKVCPVVRYANRFDLEGRYTGEIEPLIPLLGRIDQTTFDRLVVQRFASWIVRTIAGMDLSKTAETAGVTTAQAKLLLQVQDILVAPDKDTKFGSLPATQLDGFIKAHDSDMQDLAAVSQTPAFEMLGSMANLSAEALDAAKDSQNAKSGEIRTTTGESHEQFIRLGSFLADDLDGAADFESSVVWEDTSIRSLSKAADAFGKLSTQLAVPPQVLWPKIPGFTQTDIGEAMQLLGELSQQDSLLDALLRGETPPDGVPG